MDNKEKRTVKKIIDSFSPNDLEDVGDISEAISFLQGIAERADYQGYTNVKLIWDSDWLEFDIEVDRLETDEELAKRIESQKDEELSTAVVESINLIKDLNDYQQKKVLAYLEKRWRD